jgi:hypothetical protein
MAELIPLPKGVPPHSVQMTPDALAALPEGYRLLSKLEAERVPANALCWGRAKLNHVAEMGWYPTRRAGKTATVLTYIVPVANDTWEEPVAAVAFNPLPEGATLPRGYRLLQKDEARKLPKGAMFFYEATGTWGHSNECGGDVTDNINLCYCVPSNGVPTVSIAGVATVAIPPKKRMRRLEFT